MRARKVYEFRLDYDDGAIVEMVIWELSHALPGSRHPYKYRLFYGYPGRRVIGYDNERGKGDHRHRAGKQASYVFVSVARLIDDFLSDVKAARDKP